MEKLEFKIGVISNKLKVKQLKIIQDKFLKSSSCRLKALQITRKYIENHTKTVTQINYKKLEDIKLLYKLKKDGSFLRKQLILNHVQFLQTFIFLILIPTIETFKNRISFGLRSSRILIETHLQIYSKLKSMNQIFCLSIFKLQNFNKSFTSFWFLKNLISKIELIRNRKFIIIKLINFVVNKILKDSSK